EIIVHREVIAVIPILPDGNILLVEQYRTPAAKLTLEIPAGRLNEGEHPDEAVHRELREETGYLSSSIEKILSFYPAIGYSTEIIHLYIARNLTKGIPDPDEDEIIENHTYPLKKALELIQEGRIIDGKSILGLLYFERLRTEGERTLKR
ncbi:MAG: NUDIX hydrolase, partial [Chlamydiota bacterium]|nr:NUDIX hydrolase [Chlamydiota bacterium]